MAKKSDRRHSAANFSISRRRKAKSKLGRSLDVKPTCFGFIKDSWDGKLTLAEVGRMAIDSIHYMMAELCSNRPSK